VTDDRPPRPRRELPQVLLGLAVLGIALAVAVPVSASLVMDGVRDVKRTRDTIVVTGSAKEPIESNLAEWTLRVAARERTPAAAARALRAKVAAVQAYLARAHLAGSTQLPPLYVEQVSVSVPTGLKKPAFRNVPAWRISQQFDVASGEIDTVEAAAGGVNRLLLQGVDVEVEPIQYLSTQLRDAKFAALRRATADAHQRADTIAKGLGGRLGAVRDVELGVYQITPRNSTDVSGEGINDTSTRDKDVTAVVSVTFAVNR
jgi:hypothetical protein